MEATKRPHWCILWTGATEDVIEVWSYLLTSTVIYMQKYTLLHTKLSIAAQTAVNECRCFHVHDRNETIWCWHLTLVPLRTKQSSCPVGFAWSYIICIGSIVISNCSSGAMLHCTQYVVRALQMPKKVATKSGNDAKTADLLSAAFVDLIRKTWHRWWMKWGNELCRPKVGMEDQAWLDEIRWEKQ